MRPSVILLAALLLGSCTGDKATQPSSCTTGEIRCDCYPNATCNAGLACVSSVCVDLGVDAGSAEAGGGPPLDAAPGGTDASTTDAGATDGGVACDPIAQTGCAVTEKCTWIWIADGAGKVGCVPKGIVAKTGACQIGPAGETTGFDDCVAGHICVGGRCEQICTLSPDSCSSTELCGQYSGLFEGSAPQLGACDFRCNPVTQRRLYDDSPACGSPTPAAPTLGCYGLFDLAFVCANVGPGAQNLTHGSPAAGPVTGGAYLNGCAPGYAPLMRSSSDPSSPVLCLALCSPAETSSADPAGATGAPASGYTCADRGATGTGMECHFMWSFESAPSIDRNGIGFCWQPANYVGDWDQDVGTPDSAYPACVDLPNVDTDLDGVPQNYQYGCAPFSG